MSDHEECCSCKSKKEPNNLPIVIGGIIVYELAVAVILLIFILWELEKPCGCEPCGSELKSNVLELSTLED